MSNFKGEIGKLFKDREARDKRLAEILGEDSDVITLVLRGHLVIEELLFAAVSAHCQDPEHLKNARLRFPQLVSVLRALEKIPAVPDRYWNALTELNSLRNALAHNLEPKDISMRAEKFVRTLIQESELDSLPKPLGSKEAVSTAIHYLWGGMSVVAVFQSALEELIRNRISSPNDK